MQQESQPRLKLTESTLSNSDTDNRFRTVIHNDIPQSLLSFPLGHSDYEYPSSEPDLPKDISITSTSSNSYTKQFPTVSLKATMLDKIIHTSFVKPDDLAKDETGESETKDINCISDVFS
ncbi:hypothetical protein FQR65_LT12382 [Abscondita terminalis]|nr:hypothetical protein FQR65_LT12382 [Abscondita terminalis]